GFFGGSCGLGSSILIHQQVSSSTISVPRVGFSTRYFCSTDCVRSSLCRMANAQTSCSERPYEQTTPRNGYSRSRSLACLGPIDKRAQAEVPSARRTDTPCQPVVPQA